MRRIWSDGLGRWALAVSLVAVLLAACRSEHATGADSQPAEVAQAADVAQPADAVEHADATAATDGQEEAKMITDGSEVSIEYTLKLSDGTLVDTNEGKEPLTYTQGSGQILPALEKELAGLKVSDTRKVELTATDGYGEVDPKAFQEVEIDRVPEDARKVGALLIAGGPGGEQRPIRVAEVREDKVLLDFNHPLAGQALVFDVTIVGIK